MSEFNITVLDGDTIFPKSCRRWDSFSQIGNFNFYGLTSSEQILSHIGNSDAILTNKVVISKDIIKLSPRLKYIGVLATGYNNVDIEAAQKAGITVTNIPAYSTSSVAQTAISLLLAIISRVEHYSIQNRNGRWAKSPAFTYLDFNWHELAGKTFGVVGLGNTGSATAAIAAALGMRIAVFTSKAQEQLPHGYVKMGIDELFEKSDVVSLHCPLTPNTRNLVNAERLAKMKNTAILINTSRGPVVDENALAEALSANIISAAGLDVMTNEPPLPDNPLLRLDNCYITPHLAWASVEAKNRLLDIAFNNLNSFIQGNPVNIIK